MCPGRGIMECPEHGSQKNTQQCAFSCLHSGTLCASVCLVCWGLWGRCVAKALWAVDGQKMSCKQRAVLFAAVADAVSLPLMSHFTNMYFKERKRRGIFNWRWVKERSNATGAQITEWSISLPVSFYEIWRTWIRAGLELSQISHCWRASVRVRCVDCEDAETPPLHASTAKKFFSPNQPVLKQVKRFERQNSHWKNTCAASARSPMSRDMFWINQSFYTSSQKPHLVCVCEM